MKCYVYRPEITFESTNIVGNVYFTNFLKWQGGCREMFLKEHAPGVLRLVANREIVLHTSSVSCEFTDPLGASVDDAITVEMTLTHLRGGRMTMAFRYFREPASERTPVRQQIASGLHSLCCKRPHANGLLPCVFPQELLKALCPFTDSTEVLDNIAEAESFSSDLAVLPVS